MQIPWFSVGRSRWNSLQVALLFGQSAGVRRCSCTGQWESRSRPEPRNAVSEERRTSEGPKGTAGPLLSPQPEMLKSFDIRAGRETGTEGWRGRRKRRREEGRKMWATSTEEFLFNLKQSRSQKEWHLREQLVKDDGIWGLETHSRDN